MSAVFISYRRGRTSGWAGRIQDRLAERLGPTAVFQDVDDILLGEDFEAVIDGYLDRTSLLVAIVNPRWTQTLKRNHEAGRKDYVRYEIAHAIERSIPVIPVLIDGASMPSRSDLPDDLADFSAKQALDLRAASFENDMATLIGRIEQIVNRGWSSRLKRYMRSGTRLVAASVLGIVVLTAVVAVATNDNTGGFVSTTVAAVGSGDRTTVPTTAPSEQGPRDRLIQMAPFGGLPCAEDTDCLVATPNPQFSYVEFVTTHRDDVPGEELDSNTLLILPEGEAEAYKAQHADLTVAVDLQEYAGERVVVLACVWIGRDDGKGNSLWIWMGDGRPDPWDIFWRELTRSDTPSGVWRWSDVSRRAGGGADNNLQNSFDVPAGDPTLYLMARENGPRLNTLYVTVVGEREVIDPPAIDGHRCSGTGEPVEVLPG